MLGNFLFMSVYLIRFILWVCLSLNILRKTHHLIALCNLLFLDSVVFWIVKSQLSFTCLDCIHSHVPPESTDKICLLRKGCVEGTKVGCSGANFTPSETKTRQSRGTLADYGNKLNFNLDKVRKAETTLKEETEHKHGTRHHKLRPAHHRTVHCVLLFGFPRGCLGAPPSMLKIIVLYPAIYTFLLYPLSWSFGHYFPVSHIFIAVS